ncbi:bublin coiled-coil protein isoform 2-T2 [Alca torda]
MVEMRQWQSCNTYARIILNTGNPSKKYAAINSMLDQINSCLDHLEEKNDYLHACLKELLESNRQTRLEFQQQSEQQNTEGDTQGSQPPT